MDTDIVNSKKYDLKVNRTKTLVGTIKIPSSKSYTHRALIIGSLAGNTIVTNPLYCDDTESAISVLTQIGFDIKKNGNKIIIKSSNKSDLTKKTKINVGESGTLLRLILSILATRKGEFIVEGKGTLLSRPNNAIVNTLKSLGTEICGQTEKQLLPITVKGNPDIFGGKISVSGKESSQTISSLIISSALSKKDTEITISDYLVSQPYVDITIDVLDTFGIKVINDNYKTFFIKGGQKFKNNIEYNIHGDYSSAAFIISAGCLIKSDIIIKDLVDDKQGDKAIINILNSMGAGIRKHDNDIKIFGPYKLHGINIDASNTPDLVPILTVLGTFAKGKTKIYNISHLAIKESNRIRTPCEELQKLGGKVKFTQDEIVVEHSNLTSGMLSSRNDHRIAMSMSVAGMVIGNLIITDAHVIHKSYPGFVKDMQNLGAKFEMK